MNFLKKLYSIFYKRRRLARLLNLEKEYLVKFNGSFNTDKDAIKLENKIRVSVHGIEKGFSYRSPKPAFGTEKILNLFDMLKSYITLPGAKESFVKDCLSTIKYYIDTYKDNEKIGPIVDKYKALAASVEGRVEAKDATLDINKSDVDAILGAINYEDFIASRHSYRFYSKTPIDKALLEKALKIAEHTPTACNRQAQKVYIFTGEDKDRLLNIVPSRGFVNEIDTAILITVDMRAYFSEEFYQCYVDGGLYAMNLINAIHSTGLGCIPLTASMFAVNKRSELCERFNITLNEAPIITIGIGNREEKTQVNASYRKNFNEYTTWK